MKKTITLFLILATLTSTAQIGFKLGANGSQFRKGYEPDNKIKTSVTGGIYANIPLSHALSLQPELLYARKGCAINTDHLRPLSTDRYRLNMNYVTVPVVLRIGGGPLKLEIGGYAAYLVKMTNRTIWDNAAEYNENDFQRFDFGLAGGLAWKIDWITFNARYEHGLKVVGFRNEPLGWYAANRAFCNQNFILGMEISLNP